MSDRKILELRGITAGYEGHIVLDDVDFTVTETDFVGVIGANGSGKTTLLKVILGLNKPLKGSIHFHLEGNGRSHNAYDHVGYLPQVAVFDRKFPMTVFDVVLSGLTAKVGLFKHFSKEHKSRANEVMESMNIMHLKKKIIGELSGGQMQRVFLARALISAPRLLLLDEPNTFVDKSFEKSFYDVLQELNKEIAIILVSHDLGMVSSYVKSIACVNRSIYHHRSSEITPDFIKNYGCPFDLIAHGEMPHRVLKTHNHGPDDSCHCQAVMDRNKQ